MPDPDFTLLPVKQVDRAAIIDFAVAVWGEAARHEILHRWWLSCDFADATAAVDNASGRIAGLCVAVPSEWRLPELGIANARSICGWFVAPPFAGRGLGKLLVRSFAADASCMNALSISDAAIRNFAKLGWVGPFATYLRLLPVPLLARFRRSVSGAMTIASYAASSADFPDELAHALDLIDAAQPPSQLRRRRRGSDWRAHLSCRPKRQPRFHIVQCDGRPVGYFMIRPTDREAGPIYRLARLHYVSDFVLNRLDDEVLGFVFDRIGAVAPASAGALLLCTSSPAIANAAASSGWLSEADRVIGPRLADKAPRFMLGDGLVPFASADIHLTFADSDVDLNI